MFSTEDTRLHTAKLSRQIRQLVKGAHVLAASAVVAYLAAATLAGLTSLGASKAVTEVQLESPVEVTSQELTALRLLVDRLGNNMLALSQKANAADSAALALEQYYKLDDRLVAIEKRLTELPKSKSKK